MKKGVTHDAQSNHVNCYISRTNWDIKKIKWDLNLSLHGASFDMLHDCIWSIILNDSFWPLTSISSKITQKFFEDSIVLWSGRPLLPYKTMNFEYGGLQGTPPPPTCWTICFITSRPLTVIPVCFDCKVVYIDTQGLVTRWLMFSFSIGVFPFLK